MIYFAKAVKDVDELIKAGCIKIGTSDGLHARFAAIKSQIGCDIEVLGTMKGRRPVEKRLHERFRHLHCKLEWFHPGTDLLDFISESAEPWDTSSRTVAVRISSAHYRRAKIVVEELGLNMTDYLNEIIGERVFDDFHEIASEHLAQNSKQGV